MARPRVIDPNPHEKFKSYQALAITEGEDNDCSVRAVSAATGEDYKKVLALFNANGRMPRKGTPNELTMRMIVQLGFKWNFVSCESFNPPARAARGKHGITSHHPDRFPHMWKGRGNFICWNRKHMWAIVDGVNFDWSRGKALRIYRIIKVERA